MQHVPVQAKARRLALSGVWLAVSIAILGCGDDAADDRAAAGGANAREGGATGGKDASTEAGTEGSLEGRSPQARDGAVESGRGGASGRGDGPAMDAGSSVAADSGEPAPDPITVEQLCAALLERASVNDCEQGETESACRDRLERGGIHVGCLAIAAAVDKGQIVLDGVALARCLAAQETTLVEPWSVANFRCPGAFRGTFAAGDVCFFDYSLGAQECVPEAYCEYSDVCPSRCLPHARTGETCSETVRCAPGNGCVRECVPPCDGTCQPLAAEGEDCTSRICDAPLVCAAGTCIAPRPADAECTLPSDCETYFCRDGKCAERKHGCSAPSDCAPDRRCAIDANGEFQCQPRLSLDQACALGGDECAPGLRCIESSADSMARCRARAGIDGEPCHPLGCEPDHHCRAEGDLLVCRPDVELGGACANYTNEPFSNLPCRGDLHCVYDRSATPISSCQPVGELGDPCSGIDRASCVEGLQCRPDTDRCAPPGELGTPCSRSYRPHACAEGFCDCDQPDTCRCSERHPDGTPCRFPDECASGYCDPSVSPKVCGHPTEPGLCLP